jgi:hypothetical protein
MGTVYPGRHGRQHAIQLGATDAKALLKSKLPFLLPILTPAEIGQVQKVLDAAVVNPALQKDYADASRKNAAAERARGVFSDGAVYRTPDSSQMRKISAELIDVTKDDKHIRLQHPKLLAHDALKALSDNADEAAFLQAVTRALSSKGVYLRIEPSRMRDPDDRSRTVVSNKEFDVWLSFGFDGDAIPTKDGRLTRDNLLDTTAIGAGYYTQVIKGNVQTRFNETADRLRRKNKDGLSLHQDQEGARATAAPGVVGISDYLGDADYPSEKMWDQPWKLLEEARSLNKGAGNIVQASKKLVQGAMLADFAGERLNNYINATVKGAARAVFAAKVVVVVTSIIEAALNVYLLATVVTELAAGEVLVETVVEEGGKRVVKRRVRKEITREAFDKMLKTGKSTFRRSPLTENLRGEWLKDMQRIWDAADKRGIELTQKELDTLFEAAQHKWFGPR